MSELYRALERNFSQMIHDKVPLISSRGGEKCRYFFKRHRHLNKYNVNHIFKTCIPLITILQPDHWNRHLYFCIVFVGQASSGIKISEFCLQENRIRKAEDVDMGLRVSALNTPVTSYTGRLHCFKKHYSCLLQDESNKPLVIFKLNWN